MHVAAQEIKQIAFLFLLDDWYKYNNREKKKHFFKWFYGTKEKYVKADATSKHIDSLYFYSNGAPKI